MRRLLALLVAAAPAAAAAQTAGQLLFDANADFVVNQRACNDASATVGLTWLAKEETAGDFADYTGQYDLYAGPVDKVDAFPFCVVDETYRLAGETITDPPSLRVATPVEVSISELVTTAGYDCASDAKTIYVCVVWKNEAGAVKAYAKGDVGLKTGAPDAPTVVSVTPGEEALYVKVVAATTGTVEAAQFRAAAFDGYSTHYSAWESDGSVRIGGLTNGVPYTVWATARSEDGNESAESLEFGPSAETTPAPVLDGWEAYEAAGGRDSGGCRAGGAGLLALLGAGAGLLRLRRRP